jgi:hypothetical protein
MTAGNAADGIGHRQRSGCCISKPRDRLPRGCVCFRVDGVLAGILDGSAAGGIRAGDGSQPSRFYQYLQSRKRTRLHGARDDNAPSTFDRIAGLRPPMPAILLILLKVSSCGGRPTGRESRCPILHGRRQAELICINAPNRDITTMAHRDIDREPGKGDKAEGTINHWT